MVAWTGLANVTTPVGCSCSRACLEGVEAGGSAGLAGADLGESQAGNGRGGAASRAVPLEALPY